MVYTSASTSHTLGVEHQTACLNSWVEHGYPVHTVNSTAEKGTIPASKAVQIWVDRDASALYGKRYVFIDDILNAVQGEYAIITNSDIELRDPGGVLKEHIAKAEEGLILAHRIDHAGDHQGRPYEGGIDLFIIHRKFFHLLGPTLFCIGQTWWDYWIPYQFIQNKIPIRRIREPIIYHQLHPAQHNGQQWARMTAHFTWLSDTQQGRSPQRVTQQVYNLIQKHER